MTERWSFDCLGEAKRGIFRLLSGDIPILLADLQQPLAEITVPHVSKQ